MNTDRNEVIFSTKLVNDETYSRNGEAVEILDDSRDIFVTVRFKDGKVYDVYRSELEYPI